MEGKAVKCDAEHTSVKSVDRSSVTLTTPPDGLLTGQGKLSKLKLYPLDASMARNEDNATFYCNKLNSYKNIKSQMLQNLFNEGRELQRKKSFS